MDELAERRVPAWAKKLSEIKLGAALGVGVFPHAKWVEENPTASIAECPEHLLEVSFTVVGAEMHPPSMLVPNANPDPNSWPRAQAPVHEICRVPWPKWREIMDEQIGTGRSVEVPA